MSQFPPRIEQERQGVAQRQAFGGSLAGRSRNASPVHKADRVAVRVPTGATISAETFWVEDHFTVSSTTPGTFALSHVPRSGSEDITVNGVALLPVTEWTRSGVTLTVDAGVWLGLTGSWDLLVQYEVASAVALPASPLSYASAVLGDAPLGYWRMAEASGLTLVDSSGNAHDGNYWTAGATYAVPGLLAGDSNAAVQFDGTSQFAYPNTAAWMDTTTVTVECLFKASSLTGTRGLAYRENGASHNIFHLAIVGGVLEAKIWTDGTSGGSYTLTSTTALSTGTVYHVAMTYDGATVSLYLNGALDCSMATTPAPLSFGSGGAVLTFGAWGWAGANFFQGVMDECAYYGVALTAGQVAEHYAAAV